MIRPAEQFSPKSSPRGSRSPVVPRQDSTGTLKTTISLGKTPAIINTGPFYLMKGETPCQSSLTGATNLFLHEKYNLEDSYNRFCCRRKLKDQLSSFLPNLPGNGIDTPAPNDSSSLRSLIDKPPICGKELLPLTPSLLTGFRLHPGPLPEQYRFMATTVKAKKHKKQKREKDVAPAHESLAEASQESGSGLSHEKKHGKKRKHDDEREKERKKKKKEKKRKKMKHSPDSSTATAVPADRSSSL